MEQQIYASQENFTQPLVVMVEAFRRSGAWLKLYIVGAKTWSWEYSWVARLFPSLGISILSNIFPRQIFDFSETKYFLSEQDVLLGGLCQSNLWLLCWKVLFVEWNIKRRYHNLLISQFVCLFNVCYRYISLCILY